MSSHNRTKIGITVQNERIVKLKTRISELEVMVMVQKSESIYIETSEEVPDSGLNIFTPRKNFIRKGIFARELRV